MAHDISLISTVAVSLSFAFFGGWGAKCLRLPPLVGYLLAGIAVGPFTPGFVADEKLVNQLAEIGIILLMFGVGMHFSIPDLWRVKGIAIPGAIGQMLAACLMGWLLTRLWGWPPLGGWIFGLALSVASTVVLLKALESQQLLESHAGKIAIGWLIVEDLLMVLALVMLPTLATAFNPEGDSGASGSLKTILLGTAETLGKVGLFVILIFGVGRWVFPWVLSKVQASGSPELFILAVITLSLGVAFGSAQLFGVSFALGAFFAGVVIHESDASHQAEQELKPVQDLFAALFFVSVGMLFDPKILLNQPLRILAVLGIVLVGKSFIAWLIVKILGQGGETARLVAASLAQIGEFSFILAALGMELNLLPREGQSLIVAAALLSITLNPLFFQLVYRQRKTNENMKK